MEHRTRAGVLSVHLRMHLEPKRLDHLPHVGTVAALAAMAPVRRALVPLGTTELRYTERNTRATDKG